MLGTSGVVFAASDQFRSDPYVRLHALRHGPPSTWHLMGVMLSAAGSLGWARDTLAPELPFDELAGAERWPAGVEGLVFPTFAGERTPHVDPGCARAAFAGMGFATIGRRSSVRCSRASCAFGLRDCLDLISGVGIEATLGRVSGGGSRSRLWLQILASALELPLEQVAVQEGAAFGRGAAWWRRGGHLGGRRRAAVAATVRPGVTIELVSDWVEPYREALVHFRALYPRQRCPRALIELPPASRPVKPADPGDPASRAAVPWGRVARPSRLAGGWAPGASSPST